MATLLCIDDSLALVEGNEILRIIELKDEDVIKNIDTVISKGNHNPIMIFKEAVEMLVPDYSFGSIRRKKMLGDKQICIHDQNYYRKFLEYILNHESMIKDNERRKQLRDERSNFIKKDKEVQGYRQNNYYKVSKFMRQHCPGKL